MRPKYLEIEGLQSFKETQKIYFDRLGEVGLFGIFGPTGSGKSTILDAITLALYGRVYRASGTQGIINTGSNSVKVTFLFDLLNDNMRKTYRIDRIYNKKKGSEISCESRVARLIEINNGAEITLADKSTDVNKKIEELLGLKHDDFTRAVVLPQNKFQEFLLMEKAKKRDMLERIFYLEEYGKQLNDKLMKKISFVKLELSTIKGALSTLGDASEEALKDAKNTLNETEILRQEAVRAFQDIETIRTEALEVYKLVSELAFIENKIMKHQESLGEIQDKKQLLDKASKAEGLIEIIKDYKDIKEKFDRTQKDLNTIYERVPSIEKEQEKTKILYREKQEKWIIERPKLLERKTKLNSAKELEKEVNQIDKRMVYLNNDVKKIETKYDLNAKEMEETQINIKKTEEIIKTHNEEIESLKIDSEYKKVIQKGLVLENELHTVLKNYENLKKKKNDLMGAINKNKNDFEGLKENINKTKNNLELLELGKEKHKKSKPSERNEIANLVEKYHSCKSIFAFIKENMSNIDTVNEKICSKIKLLGGYKEKLDGYLKTKDKLEIQKNELAKQIKILKEKIEKDTAYIMAKSLKAGEPCPVCGSINHPNLAHIKNQGIIKTSDLQNKSSMKKLEEDLETIETAYSKCEANFMETEKKCINFTGLIKSEEGQLNELKEDLREKNKKKSTLEERLPQNMQHLSLKYLKEEIKKVFLLAEEKQKRLNKWEEELSVFEEKIKEDKEILNGLKITESSIKSQFKINKESFSQIEKDSENAFKILDEKNGLYKNIQTKYYIKSVSLEIERISSNEKRTEQLLNYIKEYEKKKDIIKEKFDEIQKEGQHLKSELIKIQMEFKNASEIKKDKRLKVKELGGECNINEEINIIDKRITDIGKEDEILFSLIKKLEQQQNSINIEKSTLENQEKIYKENLKKGSIKLESALIEKGFTDKKEAENSIIKKEKQIELIEEIDEYEKTKGNLLAQKNILEKRLNHRKITKEEWNSIDGFFNEKSRLKEEAVSKNEIAKNNFEYTKRKHTKWSKLSKENRELSNKLDMLEQIRTLLRGNSFIDFIAEERLRYIAKEASLTLGELTKYRYELELDPDIGFIIRDNANGGMHRMVTSLSGGETFITSLSLALALSKQIQLKGQSPLEFFFLDEGFGTLDRDLLDIVIDSLQRLSTTDRVIGLISHVPELRNRMSRYLLVEPPTKDGSGSKIIIKKM